MFAKIPFKVPIMTINRFCSSGIEAMSMIAAKIKANQIDCGIGAGMENMSIFPMMEYFIPKKENLSKRTYDEKETLDCLLGTGEVAENCAEEFSYTREQQDRFGMESHVKAEKAQKAGYFVNEIVPMKATTKDFKTGEKKTLVVD